MPPENQLEYHCVYARFYFMTNPFVALKKYFFAFVPLFEIFLLLFATTNKFLFYLWTISFSPIVLSLKGTFNCFNIHVLIEHFPIMIKGEDCSFTKQIKSCLIIRRNLSQYQSPYPSFFENQKDPFGVYISLFESFYWWHNDEQFLLLGPPHI
jgi:hypothetical protein